MSKRLKFLKSLINKNLKKVQVLRIYQIIQSIIQTISKKKVRVFHLHKNKELQVQLEEAVKKRKL
jgi:hypothetical protein